MRWISSTARTYSVVAAAACVVLFAVALIGGLGLKSLAILGAAVFWALKAKHDSARTRGNLRHRELRRRRLQRMRDGTWTGPDRMD
jgi:hypothetical protein